MKKTFEVEVDGFSESDTLTANIRGLLLQGLGNGYPGLRYAVCVRELKNEDSTAEAGMPTAPATLSGIYKIHRIDEDHVHLTPVEESRREERESYMKFLQEKADLLLGFIGMAKEDPAYAPNGRKYTGWYMGIEDVAQDLSKRKAPDTDRFTKPPEEEPE
jgi:hypothetical protein